MADGGKARSSKSPRRWRGEFDFIEKIRSLASNPANSSRRDWASVRMGIGDDAAVVRGRAGFDSVISSDLLVESIDFDLRTTTPEALGHKALAVSLSDIAAMGARPLYSMLSIGVPAATWKPQIVDRLYKGYFALAKKYGVVLVGGDVSRTPERLVIDSIVIGEVAERAAVLRSGAQVGDHIFVTGALGGAAAGLFKLQQGARLSVRGTRKDWTQACIQRQLTPEPRVRWGFALNKARLASAMIDISDGLSSDLTHICRASNVGALVDASRVPVDPAVLAIRNTINVDPGDLALNGGEDFELLFTVSPHDLKRMPKSVDDVPATYIGRITPSGKVMLSDDRGISPLTPGGYTHFQKPSHRARRGVE